MGVLDKLGDMFNSVSQGPNTGPPSQGFKEGAPKDYKPNRIGEGGQVEDHEYQKMQGQWLKRRLQTFHGTSSRIT